MAHQPTRLSKKTSEIGKKLILPTSFVGAKIKDKRTLQISAKSSLMNLLADKFFMACCWENFAFGNTLLWIAGVRV